MNKEHLILKWLDHNITDEELAILRQYPEFEDFEKLSDKAQLFEAPTFNENEVFQKIKKAHSKKSSSNFWKYGIAASLLIIAGIFFINNLLKGQSIRTDIAQKTEVVLPDNSVVLLNAGSEVRFRESEWQENRKVQLDGEAYFKVAKGKKFDVITNQGVVSVLGTQFVVKDRQDYYEIKTFEGLVQVQTKDTIFQVGQGKAVKLLNGKFTNSLLTTATPDWSLGSSSFTSSPLKEVLEELQLQYDIRIDKSNLPENELFTGSFSHNNLEEALQSISIPMNLNYSISSEKEVSLGYIEE